MYWNPMERKDYLWLTKDFCSINPKSSASLESEIQDFRKLLIIKATKQANSTINLQLTSLPDALRFLDDLVSSAPFTFRKKERSSWDSVFQGQTLTNSLVVPAFLSLGKVVSWKTQLQMVRRSLANCKDLAGVGIHNLQCLVVTQVSTDWLFNLQPSPISLTVALVPHVPSRIPYFTWVFEAVDMPLSSHL